MKGGMSANAFGGHRRFDKCNLQRPSLVGGVLVDVASNVPGERTLWTKVIENACEDYSMFGLGKTCHETNECERWYLHKFRATYTTNLQWAESTRGPS